MNDRRFGSSGLARGDARALVTTVVVTVYDRGPEPEWHRDRSLWGTWRRYEAELGGFEAVRGTGMAPWEAVYGLVAIHRPLLERRWAPGGPAA